MTQTASSLAEAQVQATEAFVKGAIQNLGLDGSHDWWHIHRVRNMALMLGMEEGLSVRVFTSQCEGAMVGR